MTVRRLNTTDPTFQEQFSKLVSRDANVSPVIAQRAEAIVDDVAKRGDAAVLEYSERFDHLKADKLSDLIITADEMHEALVHLPQEQRDALEEAARRIRVFHEKEKLASFEMTDSMGSVLGQRVTPIDSVGMYVPGGKAAYPSSVLMNAIPANVAGVKRIEMAVPTPGGQKNQLVLAAASLAGVSRAFTIGGAQAIAALAYGTETLPAVDKIVGPGNAYVAAAKRKVFGRVGIDMIAGPSEILIICDGKTNPDWIAMDLFSQAEHDELAQAILLTPDAEFADKVEASVERQLPGMSRHEIIGKSLANRGAIIVTKDLAEACAVADTIAPEHLEISTDEPEKWMTHIHHAGSIFLGRFTSEVLGDYCAGPNHVLPTSRTARFSNPLGVYDFQKRTSYIHVSAEGVQHLGRVAAVLAMGESLTAHAQSARNRLK